MPTKTKKTAKKGMKKDIGATAKKDTDKKSKTASKTKVTAKKGKRGVANAKSKNVAGKPTKKRPVKIATPIITHGPDMHFIPAHGKNVPAPTHDAIKEEQLFHHNEEVALQQENQKVKATRMGMKRVLRVPPAR